MAMNSFEGLKKTRLEDAKNAYNVLIKQYPETQFAKKADNLLKKVEKELSNYIEVVDSTATK